MALVESGVIAEGRGIELLDGQMVTEMPQGKLHFLLFLAIQRAFGAMDADQYGLATQPTILFPSGSALDPEFAFLRPEYGATDLPRPEDVRLVVEVSVTSLGYDLGSKKKVYANAEIPEYWVFDATRRGVWAFSDPVDGNYAQERFVQAGESINVPQVERALEVRPVFESIAP